MANPRTHRQRRGVTLLECLVAIVVLAIGVVSGVQCLNAALMVVQKANRVAMATALVRETFENVIGQSADGYKLYEGIRDAEDDAYAVITTGTTPQGRAYWEERVDISTTTMIRNGREVGNNRGRPLFPNGRKVVRIEEYVDAATPRMINRMYTVTVTVQWNTGQGVHDVQMATLVSRNLSFAK